MTHCHTVRFTAVKISQVCAEELWTMCAVGKNSGMPQGLPCAQPTTCSQNNSSHKNVKNPSKETGGGNNGGSPQSKQVGLKPACPSFQPSAAEIRDKQTLNPSGLKKRLVTLIQQRRSCQTYPHLTGNRPELKLRSHSSVTGNSNKCLKLRLSHNLLRF